MKKNTILINTSRGGQLMKKIYFFFKKIKGAVLDVFEKEPFLKKRILNLDNPIALPHRW